MGTKFCQGEKLKITRIKTKNFRQHKAIDIDLSSDQADFVIIKGNMGSGKTNLLNAVTWAFYGEVDDSDGKQSQLLNDTALHELADGDYADVEVLVELKLDNDQTAHVTRKQTFKKSVKQAAIYGEPSVTVQVVRSISNGFEVEPNPMSWIEKNLPARFRPYFLFDGEKLERFFKESDAPRIRSAIQEVARIDTLHRLKTALEQSNIDLSQKAARLTGADGDRLSVELGRLSDAISEAEAKVAHHEAKFAEAEGIESSIDQQLSGMQNLEANISRKREIDARLTSKKLRLEEQRAEFNERMRTIAPVTLLAPALKHLGLKIEDARANKVLPPPVSIDYLQELLASKICICGTDISPGHQAATHLSKLIEDYETVSEVGSALNEHATAYQIELSKLPGYLDVVKTINSGISDIEENIREDLEEQAELSRALDGQDDENVRQLGKARDTARDLAYKHRRDADLARAEISRLRSKVIELEREIERAASVNAEARRARKKAEFARRAAVIAGQLYETMNTKVREAVSNSLESQFQAMTWKEDFFSSISIDENFHVSVLNNRSIESLNRLSAGERLCLAFAFSLTLSKEAGLNFPIVVDTPMGRLAPVVQENLSRVICEATKASAGNAKNHQIILLMTETEYNERVAKVLDARKPKVLEIYFDSATAETRVA